MANINKNFLELMIASGDEVKIKQVSGKPLTPYKITISRYVNNVSTNIIEKEGGPKEIEKILALVLEIAREQDFSKIKLEVPARFLP